MIGTSKLWVGKCGGNSFSVLGYAEHVDMPLCGNRAKLFPPHPFKKSLKHFKESANKVRFVMINRGCSYGLVR